VQEKPKILKKRKKDNFKKKEEFNAEAVFSLCLAPPLLGSSVVAAADC